MPYHRNQKRHELVHISGQIREFVYKPVSELQACAWVTPEPVPFAHRETGTPVELKPGDKWGNLFDCAWFRFTGVIPEDTAGHQAVMLIDINGEALTVDSDGNPRQGLTNVNSEYDYSLGTPGKRVVPIPAGVPGSTFELWADAGCNDLFGRLQSNGTLKEARIALKLQEMFALSYDWEVLQELLSQLPEDSARGHRVWRALCLAARELTDYTEEEALKARAFLAPELARRGGDPSLTVSAVGHAHIDLAWLWPLRETYRKGARTFSTALRLMERYPDYVFGASQPQLYQWMKDMYPSLYAEVKARIEEGRWEAQGAMWVEADTNVTGGESLVRQLLYGKRFYRDEFGKEIRNLWLPDVFGYSGSLPQLLRKAGVDYFMTQKLSWSLVNQYPHHTFLWKGIDGSEVLAHLPPEDTYNSSAAPRAVAKAEKNFADKSVSENCLLLFGIGDGGGGPGEEHLERLAREKNLAGIAPVVQEPAEKFFERISKNRADLASWSGELYLERHQGTFTTQARNKRYNRKMEIALREAEYACARAFWERGRAYPAKELEAIWKEVLLYQFHDILPGSSITRVYTESLERYAKLLAITWEITREAQGAVLEKAWGNSLSWVRNEWVCADGGWEFVNSPPMGSAVPGSPPAIDIQASAHRIENEFLRVSFNEDGTIRSVFDKENQRETLAPGAVGNRLSVYIDHGDAWDFAQDYDDKPAKPFELVASEFVIDGPDAIMRQTYKFGDSTLCQDAILVSGSRRLDFVTRADWRETDKMLRASFPVDIHAEEATYEIQFGNLTRPTHCNTSWQLGQWEVCAHKWIDLSQRDYGVALLNDCKYGHRVRGNTLDINLLRSPGHPDPVADRAVHNFTYSLFPHAGDYVKGGVVHAAYELNVPLLEIGTTAAPFLRVDAPNVIVEAVKKSEDGDDLIVRLYEATGASANAKIVLPDDAITVSVVNLLEEDPRPLEIVDGSTTVHFKPFEIQTLRIAK